MNKQNNTTTQNRVVVNKKYQNKPTTQNRLVIIKKYKNDLQNQMNRIKNQTPLKNKLSQAIISVQKVITSAEKSITHGTEHWHEAQLRTMFNSIDKIQPPPPTLMSKIEGIFKKKQPVVKVQIPRVVYNLVNEVKERGKQGNWNTKNKPALPNNANSSDWSHVTSNQHYYASK